MKNLFLYFFLVFHHNGIKSPIIHADSPGVYTSEKVLNESTIDKIHLQCDVFDGSVVNGLRQPKLFSFVLSKPSGCKVFCKPETIHFKSNKSVLNTIGFSKT